MIIDIDVQLLLAPRLLLGCVVRRYSADEQDFFQIRTYMRNCYTSNRQLRVVADRQVGSVVRSEPLRISLVR